MKRITTSWEFYHDELEIGLSVPVELVFDYQPEEMDVGLDESYTLTEIIFPGIPGEGEKVLENLSKEEREQIEIEAYQQFRGATWKS
jgi:hypothetical protein